MKGRDLFYTIRLTVVRLVSQAVIDAVAAQQGTHPQNLSQVAVKWAFPSGTAQI